MLVPTEADLTLCPEGATDTKFVVVVQSGDVDRLRLVLVYARVGGGGPCNLLQVKRHDHGFHVAGGHGGLYQRCPPRPLVQPGGREMGIWGYGDS